VAKMKIMKKTMIVISGVGLMISAAFVLKYSNGKTDSTGSPGENTCGSCHNGGSGTTITNVSFNPSISSGSYTPNQTYTITVNVINNAFNNFSFACEILNSSTLSNAGTMSNAGSGVQFMTGINGRNVATHTAVKTGTGSASFTFEWTAPSSGNITLYAIGNAVNGNGSPTGDKPSSTFTLSLSPDLNSVTLPSSSISSMLLYPNPVKEVVNIHLTTNKNIKQATIHLLNTNGKTLITQNLNNIQSGLNFISVQIPSSVPNGLYFVRLSIDNETITRVILIQK